MGKKFDVQPTANKPILSWNEIRVNAALFAKSWANAHYEKGETHSFYNDFFTAFGQRRRDVAVYEKKVTKLSNNIGFIDLFWPGKLLVEQKSAGLSLKKAGEQATDYFLTLQDHEKPRYILLSDFQTFELIDLETSKEDTFSLYELPQRVELFDFIAGYRQQAYKDQDPANIIAMNLMSSLHLQLEKSGYSGSDLERLLVRIMFCLFADNTGIFPLQAFLRYVDDKKSRDIGPSLMQIFQVLDTPPEKRQTNLDADLAQLPYVDGLLFSEKIKSPNFDESMYGILLKCCYFDWSKVSPALFGSLFQTVMLPDKQRKGGAHYTSERNIMKIIHPLFLDDLREEFHHIKNSRSIQRHGQLEEFHNKLGSLTFLDPACGCGNFLILAYRELRLLELEVLRAIFPNHQMVSDVKQLSKIDVDQFYGIEIEEFPVRIAEAAMWLMDHQMNMVLSQAFGQSFIRFPLEKSAHIVYGNALRQDWKNILPQKRLSYILSNPPFVGKKEQSELQKQDMECVFQGLPGNGVLDYVAAWYWKAAQYIQGTHIKVAFVSTNSITQGEQVPVLWRPLLDQYHIGIQFAHRTFKWTIDERKLKGLEIAAVHCVIIGFSVENSLSRKQLFEYEANSSKSCCMEAKNINPYLIDASNVVISKRSKPINGAPHVVYGSILYDGGNLIFSESERDELLRKFPRMSVYFRQLIGGKEFINGIMRWCLWLVGADLNEIRKYPEIRKRINAVKNFRLSSGRGTTIKLADSPTLFGEIRQPDADYLLIPKVSSQERFYLPIAFCNKEIIANGSSLIVPKATLYHFGIISSLMHNAWMRSITGRTKSDYQYSASIVYNNFPWPSDVSSSRIQEISEKAKAVLDARACFPSCTLASLYDPCTMPLSLLKSHQALDKSVDKAYRKEAFADERQRIEYLFMLYSDFIGKF
jgi:type I restriction-modification system DNA methylase subunit